MSLRENIKQKQKENKHFVWNGVEVFIKDPITNPKISIKDILASIAKKIPDHLLSNIDTIYIGQFDFLKDRNIQAMYENSSIFVTNDQKNEDDMADDIVHEIAHSIEEMHGHSIYSDGTIEREFLNKRKHLFSLLRAENIEADLSDFMTPEYNKGFDEYLYQNVGYPMLNMLGSSIFYSPYAITSLREYFANGFEAMYYFDDYDFIKNSCPKLYSKLYSLIEDPEYDIKY
jgi:hypothetical protein|tara:strand:- start:4620 stop:5309 length:690 start_codon:yes stop_codon:yes gene_type:complete